jgi:hypothetical protein
MELIVHSRPDAEAFPEGSVETEARVVRKVVVVLIGLDAISDTSA